MQTINPTGELDRDEIGDLISADKVQGTAVYDSSGDKIGSIHDVMLNKKSGKVAYAVMSFGGFLGIGEKYHPLPWDALDYDTSLNGYSVGMAGEGFREAPSYDSKELATDRWNDTTDDYYADAISTGRFTRRLGAGSRLGTAADGGLSGGTGVTGAHRHGGATGAMGTGGMTGDGTGRV